MANFLVVISLLLLLITGIVVWLFIEHRKLRHQYQLLLDYVERSNRDIAGLCSAAVSVDHQVSVNNERLNQLVGKIATDGQQESSTQAYQAIIQKVQAGAEIEQLVRECSISRDEAALLIRLHGKNQRG